MCRADAEASEAMTGGFCLSHDKTYENKKRDHLGLLKRIVVCVLLKGLLEIFFLG